MACMLCMKPARCGGSVALALAAMLAASQGRAQSPSVSDIKGKIFDARMAKEMFAAGLKHCGELNGSNFYFAPRDRVLNLDDYHRSLDNLVQQHVFNPEKHRPWTPEDSALRWEQVKQEAAKEQTNCALVADLPQLEKQLEALERKGSIESGTETKN